MKYLYLQEATVLHENLVPDPESLSLVNTCFHYRTAPEEDSLGTRDNS